MVIYIHPGYNQSINEYVMFSQEYEVCMKVLANFCQGYFTYVIISLIIHSAVEIKAPSRKNYVRRRKEHCLLRPDD